MLPDETKPFIIVTCNVDGETKIMLGSTGWGDWVRMTPGDELRIELPLFSQCPKCRSDYRVHPVLRSDCEKGFSVRPEPAVEPK